MTSHRPVLTTWALGLALGCAAPALPSVTAGESPGVRQLPLTVSETAGIRRFGYPVSTVLNLPQPVPDASHFRLLDDGKPVRAQFRPLDQTRDGVRKVSLDFAVDHAPLESRKYVVEYGPGVEAGPEPKGGISVTTTEDEFRVRRPGDLEFVVPRNLLGLLRRVRTARTDYLRTDSPGLWIRYRDDIHYRAGGFGPDGVPTAARVVKAGPLAATLRFEGTEALRGNRSVASSVEMDFPLSKSWVRVRWEVDDPEGHVAGLGTEVNLNLEGEPVLADFGAGSLVYAALRKGQAAVLRGRPLLGEPAAEGPRWETLVGPADRPRPYVVAPPGARGPDAEGWAHVMDRQRATAVAMAGFADAGQEAEITVGADGRLQLWKQFARGGAVPPPGAKKLTFWLHFVPMPVQVGAATSPQAMLAPLQVTVRPPQER
jgi:hypothetical protein